MWRTGVNPFSWKPPVPAMSPHKSSTSLPQFHTMVTDLSRTSTEHPLTSLISSDNLWAVWAILLSAAAFGLWAEQTRWGARLSGAVITIGTTFVLSNVGIAPIESPAYSMVWSYLVPMAIPLLLFRADVRRIVRESGPTLLAFLAGGVGTVIGTIIAFNLVPLGPEAPKMAGIFCATYVGGSINYVATSEALGLRSPDLLTAGFAADNLVMTLYFLVLFALPSVKRLAGAYRRRGTVAETAGSPLPTIGNTPLRLRQMAISLAISSILCALGYGVAEFLALDNMGILVVTALTVLMATLFPRRFEALPGAMDLGTLLMMVFFAVIGASANIGAVLRAGPLLFVFAGVILLVHLIFLLLAGKLLRLDLREIVIASNANMGGPTTAAAMATARKWDHLITPAILCGMLGYALATFVGVAIGKWLGA